VTITFWKAGDEVHRDVGEWFGVNGRWNSIQRGSDAVCQVLVLLAYGATFDIFRDPCSSARPKIVLIDASYGFISTGMAVQGTFVPRVHDFAFQSLIWGYYELLAFDVSPEGFVWIVYTFNGESAFPFFHEASVIILDGSDKVFQ
jgi:hypothetical protein